MKSILSFVFDVSIRAFSQFKNDTSFISIDLDIHIFQMKKDKTILLFTECFHLYLSKPKGCKVPIRCAALHIADTGTDNILLVGVLQFQILQYRFNHLLQIQISLEKH